MLGVIQIDHTHDGRQSMYRLKGWYQNHNPDSTTQNECNIANERLNQKDKQGRTSQNIGSETMLCRIFHNSSTTGATRRAGATDSSVGTDFIPDLWLLRL